ncbi:C-type lectin domain family 4 member C-like isoform 3-T3 [Trichechus inunguis]
MVQGQPQGRETEVWWHQVKVWSAAVVSLLLLSACFIVSCLVNHDNFVYTKIGRKLHKLQDHQQYLSHLTCFKERKGLKDWHCCPTSWSPFQSSCYFISTELKNCTDSEKNCSEMGAHLMMINTKEEQVLSYSSSSSRSWMEILLTMWGCQTQRGSANGNGLISHHTTQKSHSGILGNPICMMSIVLS